MILEGIRKTSWEISFAGSFFLSSDQIEDHNIYLYIMYIYIYVKIVYTRLSAHRYLCYIFRI